MISNQMLVLIKFQCDTYIDINIVNIHLDTKII